MSKKENVHIIRADDFESIDEELAQAISLLEDTNTRVLEVLTSETADGETAELPFDQEEVTGEATESGQEDTTPPKQDGEAAG